MFTALAIVLVVVGFALDAPLPILLGLFVIPLVRIYENGKAMRGSWPHSDIGPRIQQDQQHAEARDR
jgi:hypothetical protein